MRLPANSATNKFVPQHMSLVHVNLPCSRVGLPFEMILFWRSLFLYSSVFYHHIQFQKLTVTLPSNGSKPKKLIKKKVGLLHFASDWKLQFDLDNKLVIPSFIAVSQLRPDVVLYSLSTKIVIILELIVLVRKTWRSGTAKNKKNTILCPWQWFPMVGQYICFLLRLVLGATALQM